MGRDGGVDRWLFDARMLLSASIAVTVAVGCIRDSSPSSLFFLRAIVSFFLLPPAAVSVAALSTVFGSTVRGESLDLICTISSGIIASGCFNKCRFFGVTAFATDVDAEEVEAAIIVVAVTRLPTAAHGFSTL